MRLLDANGVSCWLSDSSGAIVFLSDALRDRLGIDDDLPDDLAKVLLPPSFARHADGLVRGHQTCKLDLPGTQGAQSTTAHFVELSGESLVLGCLGEFTPDSAVPWEVWFGPNGLRQAARVADRISQLRADRTQRCQRLLAGESTPSRQFRNHVDLACRVSTHLALAGDPCSGRSELASFIHFESSEQTEAYVCVDASLMDAELLEVYASAAIVPLSESPSNRSTLCLERLDEMPVEGQDRLVQWMQTWPDRLRLIGLLSRPVSEFDANAMRPQLADAMSVYAIPIPSLASRSEDLPLLAQSLVRSTRLSREAIKLVESYPWPGQWDEFLAAMKFAENVVRGDRITREHFPLAIRSFRGDKLAASEIVVGENTINLRPIEEPIGAFEIQSLDEAVKTYEKELIAKAMAAANGNKAEAARRLGISRSRLLRKLDGE